MRAIALPLALAAALATGVPAAAPLRARISAKKLTGNATPPRPRSALLTVHYILVAGTRMTLTTPAGSFACAPPTLPAGLPMANCTLAVPRASTVALTANFSIFNPVGQIGNGKPMTGKQWLGACAGTISDTCTLAMTEDRTVDISPYTAP